MVFETLVNDVNELSYRFIKTSTSAIIDIGEVTKQRIYFNIKTKVIKKRSDKNGCKVYSSRNEYINCIEKAVRSNLVNLLGCVPPWMEKQGDGQVCVKDIEFKNEGKGA